MQIWKTFFMSRPDSRNVKTATSLCEVNASRILMNNTNLSLPRQRIELQASNIYDGMEISLALSSRHWTKWRVAERTSEAGEWRLHDFPTNQSVGRKSSVQKDLLQQHTPWTLSPQMDLARITRIMIIMIIIIRMKMTKCIKDQFSQMCNIQGHRKRWTGLSFSIYLNSMCFHRLKPSNKKL